MKALVSGATGFIGSSIVRELLKDNVEVKVLIRKGSNTKNIDGLDLEKAYGDIRDKDSMKAALKGCNVFYQTAALYANWAPDKKLFYDINVEGTKVALSAALEAEVDKVVYTSSIASIGVAEGGKLAAEDTKFNIENPSPYIYTKYLAESEAKKFCDKGLQLVIVNPAGVMGVRDIKPTPSGEFIVKILNKKMPGYMDAGMNFVDVEDVARGHILAAKRGKVGERYILGNQNMTVKEFFDLVAELGGVETPQRKISYPVAFTLALFSELISAINGKKPMVSMSIAKHIGKYAYYDCSKAVKELGMPQTPLRETIQKAVDWYRQNGYVNTSR